MNFLLWKTLQQHSNGFDHLYQSIQSLVKLAASNVCKFLEAL